MPEILIIRHGDVQTGPGGKLLLSSIGESQAHELNRVLSEFNPELAAISPLERTLSTAYIALLNLIPEVQVWQNLIELRNLPRESADTQRTLRAHEVLRDVTESGYSRVALFTHAGFSRYIMSAATGQDRQKFKTLNYCQSYQITLQQDNSFR